MANNAAILKLADHLYLYADGHAVVVHSKDDRQAGKVQWVTLHESIDVRAMFPNGKGRIIVKGPASMAMLLAAIAVAPSEPSLIAGSENTRKRDIPVANFAFNFGHGNVHIPSFPGLISWDFTYQPEYSETWDDLAEKYHWCDYNITARYPVAQKKAA